jgi:hypothetical protein
MPDDVDDLELLRREFSAVTGNAAGSRRSERSKPIALDAQVHHLTAIRA